MNEAYEEGKLAYQEGKAAVDNPYPPIKPGMNDERIGWRNGWEDERHCVEFGFAPNEIVGPGTSKKREVVRAETSKRREVVEGKCVYCGSPTRNVMRLGQCYFECLQCGRSGKTNVRTGKTERERHDPEGGGSAK